MSDTIRTPFTITIDKAEKAPFVFTGLRARSFIDKEMRLYDPIRTERRYLGIGAGDYSLDGFEGRVGIERKSAADFQATLLGWPADQITASTREIDRRGRFKRELAKLALMECKAVIVESPLGRCLETCPQWGVRTASENMKYLAATFLSWSQEFFAIPWIFADDKEMAAVVCFRLLEQFWHRATSPKKRKTRSVKS